MRSTYPFNSQTRSGGFFYWWTPDDTFVELSPKQLIYPPTSAYEWSQGIFTTATQDLILGFRSALLTYLHWLFIFDFHRPARPKKTNWRFDLHVILLLNHCKHYEIPLLKPIFESVYLVGLPIDFFTIIICIIVYICIYIYHVYHTGFDSCSYLTRDKISSYSRCFHMLSEALIFVNIHCI